MVSMKKILVFLSLLFFLIVSPVMAGEEDFHLPNPGMLPTNPLYIFKVVRDNLLLSITQNPVNRAELLIFSSNKSLATALALSKQHKNSEAAVSMTKSMNFLSEAVTLLPKVSSREVQLNLSMAIIVAIRAQEQLSQDIIAKAPANSQVLMEKQLLSFEDTKIALVKKIFAKAQK